MPIRLRALVASLALISASVVGAGTARANGAFPDSFNVMMPESEPNVILLGTNFGIVSTSDGGQSWVWRCEQADNSFATSYQLGAAPNYRLYTLSSLGLGYSNDLGCGWSVATGFGKAPVLDYFPDPTNANRVLAIAAPSTDAGSMFEVFESSDGGASFGPVRYEATTGDVLTGVEIARAAPMTVYLSLLTGGQSPKLVRSTDGGTNWKVYDLAPSLPPGTLSVKIASVDAADPNKIFLRVRSPAGDALAISKFDAAGNATTTTALPFPAGVMLAFARLANGHLVAGGQVGVDNVAFRSTDGGASFQPLPTPPFLKGLSARGSTLYLVTDYVANGYAIGTSTDEGMSWQPFMTYDQIAAIDACDKQVCQADCLARADMGQWSADFCAAAPPDAGLGGTGGAAGAGVGGSGGRGAAGGGASGASGAGGAPSPSGCHCAAGGGAGGPTSAGLTGMWLALAWVRRGRRANRSRSGRSR